MKTLLAALAVTILLASPVQATTTRRLSATAFRAACAQTRGLYLTTGAVRCMWPGMTYSTARAICRTVLRGAYKWSKGYACFR